MLVLPAIYLSDMVSSHGRWSGFLQVGFDHLDAYTMQTQLSLGSLVAAEDVQHLCPELELFSKR